MVTVKTFNSRIEADLAQGLLESEGIYCIVAADDSGGLRPSMAFASGVELKVKPEDAEEAKKIIIDAFYVD